MCYIGRFQVYPMRKRAARQQLVASVGCGADMRTLCVVGYSFSRVSSGGCTGLKDRMQNPQYKDEPPLPN